MKADPGGSGSTTLDRTQDCCDFGIDCQTTWLDLIQHNNCFRKSQGEPAAAPSMPPFGQLLPAHLLAQLPPPPHNSAPPGMRLHSGFPPPQSGKRHPSGNPPQQPMRHPSGSVPQSGSRQPSGNSTQQHGGGRQHSGGGGNVHQPRTASIGGQAGIDLAALAAMMGTGAASQGKVAPPITAISLEDLGKDNVRFFNAIVDSRFCIKRRN